MAEELLSKEERQLHPWLDVSMHCKQAVVQLPSQLFPSIQWLLLRQQVPLRSAIYHCITDHCVFLVPRHTDVANRIYYGVQPFQINEQAYQIPEQIATITRAKSGKKNTHQLRNVKPSPQAYPPARPHSRDSARPRQTWCR